MSEKRWLSRFRESGAGFYLLAALTAFIILMLTRSEPAGPGSENTPLEERLMKVLSKIDGAGSVSAMVVENEGEIDGVLIVCEGAGDLMVRMNVQEAARTLLGVDNNKISVQRMGAVSGEGG